MTVVLSAAITILVPILVALVLLILPRANAIRHHTHSTVSRPHHRHEVNCVEIPELLEASARDYVDHRG